MKGRGATRRTFLGGTAGAVLTACATPRALSRQGSARDRIDALVARGDVPAAGLVVVRKGETIFSHATGLAQGAAGESPALAFTPSTKMRVASVSKLATALTAHRLAEAGAIDLDADISGAFAVSIRHPAFPESPVTMRHLLSHTGGLEDPETYWIAAPGLIEELFVLGMWRAAAYGPPGTGFRYANFGYGLVATLLERATGERFDDLARRLVFDSIGSSAGFNWSGVARTERLRGASIYRKVASSWRVEADGLQVLASDAPSVLIQPGSSLSEYILGTNGTLFSPQGGLRASLVDLCRLAREVSRLEALTRPVWRFEPETNNGDTEGGYFTVFGSGAHVHDGADSPLQGFRMAGHHGEAYGLYCGAWDVPEQNAQFAYAVTGTPEGDVLRATYHPAANIYTAELFAAARQVLLA